MSQAYSNPDRENDPHALPDLEIFQLTAREAAEFDEDMVWEYRRNHKFRPASVNSRTREAMFDAMIEAEGITGGWFYWYCFPGCLPHRVAIGPFDSYTAAKKATQDEAAS